MKRCLSCRASFDRPDWACPVCHASPERRGDFLAFAPDMLAGDGSDADYAQEALLAAEERHFWFHARRNAIVWALGRYFPSPTRVLEVGCGTGFVLAGIRGACPGAALRASDVLLDWLPHARARVPDAEIFQMDARRMPFRDELDLIGAFDVVEHIQDDEAVLAEMRQALRPRGGLLLSVPQHPWLWSAVDEFSHHKRRYTRRDLREKLRRAGFEPLRFTSLFAPLLPAIALARLCQPRMRESFDPAAELRVSGLLNRGLGALCTVELSLVRAGLSFPAGGSLLAIARRT